MIKKAALGYALFVIPGALLLLYLRIYHSWRFPLEAGLCLVLILIVVRQRGILSRWAALRWPYRVFLVTLVASLLGGQLLGRSSETFPFVEWAMYTQPPQTEYFSYTAVLQSGRERPLPVIRAFRSIGFQLWIYLARTGLQIADSPEGPARQDLIRRYESALRAVARQYNLHHGDNPVRVIRVSRCGIPTVKDYHGRNSIDCQPFWHLSLPPEDLRRAS